MPPRRFGQTDTREGLRGNIWIEAGEVVYLDCGEIGFGIYVHTMYVILRGRGKAGSRSCHVECGMEGVQERVWPR